MGLWTRRSQNLTLFTDSSDYHSPTKYTPLTLLKSPPPPFSVLWKIPHQHVNNPCLAAELIGATSLVGTLKMIQTLTFRENKHLKSLLNCGLHSIAVFHLCGCE